MEELDDLQLLRRDIKVIPEIGQENLGKTLIEKYGTQSTSLLKILTGVRYKKLQRFLRVVFYHINEKYSDSVWLEYKGHFFTVYCLCKEPRIGGMSYLFGKSKRDLSDYSAIGLELANRLTKSLVYGRG